MAKKSSIVFVCNGCGYESSKWLGRCPTCNEWNSFYEEKVVSGTGSSKLKDVKKAEVVSLNKIEETKNIRIKTGIEELDRVLGGGFVKGSLTLLRRRTWYWEIHFNTSNMQ